MSNVVGVLQVELSGAEDQEDCFLHPYYYFYYYLPLFFLISVVVRLCLISSQIYS